jgi:hypothetical protein
MEPQNEIIKGVFAMLDAQLTSKEFDEQIERHRFLSEVKAKKFTRLEALGIIQKNAKRPAGSHIPKEEKKHIAVTGYAMVTEQDMFPSEVGKHFNILPDTFRAYCKKEGLTLPNNGEIRTRRDALTLSKALDLINLRGQNLLEAADSLELSTAGVTKILGRCGYAYNRDIKKIKRIPSK